MMDEILGVAELVGEKIILQLARIITKSAPRRTHHSMHAMRPARQKTITMASTGIDFLTSKNPLKLLNEKPARYTNTDIDVKTERIQT
jgi:hypothetical protein